MLNQLVDWLHPGPSAGPDESSLVDVDVRVLCVQLSTHQNKGRHHLVTLYGIAVISHLVDSDCYTMNENFRLLA